MEVILWDQNFLRKIVQGYINVSVMETPNTKLVVSRKNI